MKFIRFIVAIIVLCLGLGPACSATSTDNTGSRIKSKKNGCSSASCRISNIVVLMMENRSFDHLLGWLKADYKSTIEGLSDNMSLPRNISDLSLGTVAVTRNAKDTPEDDPKHDFDNIAIQINNNKMDGFVYDSIMHNLTESNPVDMFDSNSAPIINTLAKEFAVFDAWFASIPGPTDPNRQFAMSGTSLGVLSNFNGTLYSQQSYFDYLREHGRTFGGYYQDDLWILGAFEDLLDEKNSVFIKDLDSNFYRDCEKGELADFTWLQPRMNAHLFDKPPSWQHPDATLSEGEKLIKNVYEALRSGPKWNETLLLITYDEHGGYYDHVSPPNEGVPSPDDHVASNGFKFDQLGIRLPTIAISPWIAKGTVVSKALSNEQPTASSHFDSTSTLATTNIILDLNDAPPLGNRMAWANTFAGLVEELEAPREDCPLLLPEIATSTEAQLMANFQRQRSKPLNEHLESQLLYFCTMNYPGLHKKNECPGRKEVMHNQGLASDWLHFEQAKFLANNRKKASSN